MTRLARPTIKPSATGGSVRSRGGLEGGKNRDIRTRREPVKPTREMKRLLVIMLNARRSFKASRTRRPSGRDMQIHDRFVGSDTSCSFVCCYEQALPCCWSRKATESKAFGNHSDPPSIMRCSQPVSLFSVSRPLDFLRPSLLASISSFEPLRWGGFGPRMKRPGLKKLIRSKIKTYQIV
ncbi:hypothetical protein BDP81DRAFT_1064 [Colletotrichum phormii]|uniref:Uncharacterized protein n=1 Tax=Colletotrichum phormii TaxID=359342 RepID=A0AAJ0A2H7_9PEZI|nr:uncharacterized protein BDP81DRAFT_1064 [Colletotrichum phormii]KAK1655221.1 hypothetical protein BDP81DRAFT_1064 [Colletotrichum phormii]